MIQSGGQEIFFREQIMEPAKKSGSIWGWGLILALAVNLLIGAPRARAEGPMEGVRGLIEEVQSILKNNPQKAQRVDLVEKATAKHLDFREMAKRSLESTWNGLNQGQQDEFVRVFSELLKASYANHLDDFAKTRVAYQGETNKADSSEVCILVIRPNDKIPVSFRLLHEPEGWMIYDMVIEGVSMVDNFRTQFAAMIQECSYGELVRCMKDKLKAECKG
jgi:phospholipid transport system substrate-binding protein